MNEFMSNVFQGWFGQLHDTSGKGILDKVDWAKLARNTLQVSGSAALSAGVGYLGSELLNVDWGTVAVFALPAIHFVMDLVTKKLKNNVVEPVVKPGA